MAFPKSMSCLVATNMNIFICSGTWRGGCLCWTAWPPQQDAGQDALWEVNELRSFSVGSDISLAWRDLDHLQDFISSQYNMGHYWFLSSSRWSHQQLKLIIHDHQSSGSASPRSRSMTGWRCTGSILFSRRKKIVSLLRWGSEVEKIIEKGKDGGKAFSKECFKVFKIVFQVTEHEVQNSVRSIPKLDTLILVKVEIFTKEQMIRLFVTNIQIFFIKVWSGCIISHISSRERKCPLRRKIW